MFGCVYIYPQIETHFRNGPRRTPPAAANMKQTTRQHIQGNQQCKIQLVQDINTVQIKYRGFIAASALFCFGALWGGLVPPKNRNKLEGLRPPRPLNGG